MWCPELWGFVPCASYADAGCVPCEDPSMPCHASQLRRVGLHPGVPQRAQHPVRKIAGVEDWRVKIFITNLKR